MDREKELKEIFNDDPYELLKIKPKSSNQRTSDDRLIVSFEDINNFYEEHQKEPQANQNDIMEHKFYLRLKGIRSDKKKMIVLKPYDRFNLLDVEVKNIKSLDDIFNEDTIGLLEDDSDNIFDLKHVKPASERDKADFVARRKPCKNFEKYEYLFKQVQDDLSKGKRKIITFNEHSLKERNFYILNGMVLYFEKMLELDELDEERRIKIKRNYNKKDGRIRCIFDNGTESSMLYRSLAKALHLNGRTITKNEEQISASLFDTDINEDDISAGFIYICKSKNDKEEINTISDLYKIGFSKDVNQRIKNAENDPTFLMGPVSLITYFECYNFNSNKLENLLHKFFSESCLDIDIYDNEGIKHKPREWFIAPLHIIEKVIELIINGKIINYKYDIVNKQIIDK